MRKGTHAEYVNRPKRVSNHSGWQEIHAGYMWTCGIKEDSSLWCWGKNATGQIGDGTTTNRPSPVSVKKPCKWITVALGDYHTCGICSDHSLWCWGGHKNAVVRGDHRSTTTIPELVILKPDSASSRELHLNFSEIVLGDGHTCGLTTEGKIYCWGGDPLRLGVGGKKHGSVFPILIDTSKINPSKPFKSVVVGSGHSCGVTIHGQAYCWGRNDRGQVGSGAPEKWILSPSPVNTRQITGSKIFKTIFAGTYHTCSIMTDGVAYCWGANDKGQLGNGNYKDQKMPVRVETKYISGNKEIVQITAGFAHSCGITKDHVAYCWGEYVPGECDVHPDNGRCPLPAQLDTSEVTGTKRFKWISAGCAHSCAVTMEGKGYCWGNNEDGRLGAGLAQNKQ